MIVQSHIFIQEKNTIRQSNLGLMLMTTYLAGDRSALWNADAHLKATILGSSETFEVSDGKLAVGKTGYIYFADFDTDELEKENVVS